MTQALYFVVKTLAQLYLILYLLRFWLPWVQADFRNPIAQAVLRFTSPLVIPVRRFVPSFGRLDTATVLVTFVMEFAILFVLSKIVGANPGAAVIAYLTLLELCILSLNLFFFAILIRVILSWIAPQSYNPIAALAGSIAEPVLRPFQRLVPPIGGLDISPILAIVLIQAVVIYLQTLKPIPL
ncbi:MAG: YggT family protein [Woeseiaceae bacterium]|nr:YggT family protein [Woeseiaceae bacterium]